MLRVPGDGRAYEGYGEDPLLVSEMGVADIQGIQSEGVLAQAKHFASYSQETNRGELDDVVSAQALNELYLPPFKAAVTEGGVASVMCAYPRLNGTFQCQDPQLLGLLGQWGFTGFVRSDLGAVHDPAAAIDAGTDLIKPASARRLVQLASSGRLPTTAVDTDVRTVLTSMFGAGVIGRNPRAPRDPVDSASDTGFALDSAERSAVLLKNSGSVLPLDTSRVRSIAVIGADASTAPVTTGHGSSQVLAPFVSRPLDAIRRRAGQGTSVSYSDGGSTTAPLPPIPTGMLTPASGSGPWPHAHPHPGPARRRPAVVQTVEPTVDVNLTPHPVDRPTPVRLEQRGDALLRCSPRLARGDRSHRWPSEHRPSAPRRPVRRSCCRPAGRRDRDLDRDADAATRRPLHLLHPGIRGRDPHPRR